MKLTLRFSPTPQDAAQASGTVRVVDQSEADAPARELAAHPFGPMPLDPGGRSVTVTLVAMICPFGALPQPTGLHASAPCDS